MHAGDLNLRTNLHCSRQILTLAAAWSCAATSSTNAFNGVGCHHAPRLPRSNPHSARSTTACHFPRFPSLEAFGRRPQASVSAAPSVIGRHPKPFTTAAILSSSPTSSTPRRFDCSDIDLSHSHHRFKRALCLVTPGRHCFHQYTGRDLPRHAPLVLAPAARTLLTAILDNRLPIAIRLSLIVGSDLKREGFTMLEG